MDENPYKAPQAELTKRPARLDHRPQWRFVVGFAAYVVCSGTIVFAVYRLAIAYEGVGLPP